MFSDALINKIDSYYPDVKIDYKDRAPLMKFLGVLLFFTPGFSKTYITTIGSTIYYPSQTFINVHPVTSIITLLHELVHVHDTKKLSRPIFSFLYLMPQMLSLFLWPLFFILSWKIALPITLLPLLPLPSYFRMNFERRAYMVSLYVMKKLNDKYNYNIDLEHQKNFFAAQFSGIYYYLMWPFGVKNDLGAALQKIQSNQYPYDDPALFAMIDDLLTDV